jgi:hypothetical protein
MALAIFGFFFGPFICSPENFFSHSPRFFSPYKKPILPLKSSVNTNRIFKNFGFYLPKFCDIATGVSIFYFSKNPKKSVNVFRIFQKKRFLGHK